MSGPNVLYSAGLDPHQYAPDPDPSALPGRFPGSTMNAAQLHEQYVTRPGTPMMGPYSTNQMDDFYAALSRGEAKPSGLMNLLQHLIVAEQCAPNSRVLDVCCGRGLALPLLYRYAPKIGGYVGLDISAANLDEARERIQALRATYGDPFPVELVECFPVPGVRFCVVGRVVGHSESVAGGVELEGVADSGVSERAFQ